jgi:hypothetical protein
MADKAPSIDFITPRVIVQYPRLIKPDAGPKGKEGKLKFNVKGVFNPTGAKFVVGKTTLSIDALTEKLEAIRDEHFDAVKADLQAKKKGAAVKKMTKAPVFRPVLDEEGNETEQVYVSAKTYAQYTDKKSGQVIDKKPPTMFDAKGNVIKGKLPNVGGGSTMKIAVTAKAYYVDSSGEVGISYYLNSTQLIDLVEFGGSTNPGFADEGGGYEAEADDPLKAVENVLQQIQGHAHQARRPSI